MPRYIDATDLVRRVLVERDKIPLEVVPRYNFGVPEPFRHGQAMRGGIRKALREIETSPTIDAVEVVRCRDCRYNAPSFASPDKFRLCSLTTPWSRVAVDFYCAHGEKMDAEVEG